MKFTHKWNHPPEPADLRTCKRCGQKEWEATKTICAEQLRGLVEKWRSQANTDFAYGRQSGSLFNEGRGDGLDDAADELAAALEGK